MDVGLQLLHKQKIDGMAQLKHKLSNDVGLDSN